jgi:ABC-type polysaccharide/polyol phosphate export permease
MKSVFFPRAILPVATALFNFAQYLLTIVIFLPLMLVLYRVRPAPEMLAFPLFLLAQLAFTIGVGLIIATGTAFFRDIRHFLEIGLSALFWLTPIVYTSAMVPPRLLRWLKFSPASPFILAYQQIFFYRRWPDADLWLIAGIYSLAAVVMGMWIMLRHEDRFSEQV